MDFDLGEINEKKSFHLGGLNCRVVNGKWVMSYDTIELDFDATLSNENIYGRVVASKDQRQKQYSERSSLTNLTEQKRCDDEIERSILRSMIGDDDLDIWNLMVYCELTSWLGVD